jgi:hypothetical protein
VQRRTGVPRTVLLRDLLILQLKLLLDGVKDVVLIQLSLVAGVIDLLFGGARRGRLFYAVLRLSERFDLWLNLHRAAQGAESHPDGLVGASPPGADGLISRLESVGRAGTGAAHARWKLHRRASRAP